MTIKLGVCLGVVALGGAAHAQLVFGTSTTNSATSGAYFVDLDSGQGYRLWSGTGNKKVGGGLAADNDAGIVWGNDNWRLYTWQFGTRGTQPVEVVSTMLRRGTDNNLYITGLDGMTMANGTLYAYTNFNGFGAPVVEDGIYSVNPNAAAGTPHLDLLWRHDDLAYNFEGIEFNPADNLFYAVNKANPTSIGGPSHTNPGLYTIDLFGDKTITKIADFHPYLAGPEGIALGGGYLWLTGKQMNETELKITGYNLSTGTFDRFLALDGFVSGGLGAGAAWAPQAVPEPATLAALGLGALALVRRRRAAKR